MALGKQPAPAAAAPRRFVGRAAAPAEKPAAGKLKFNYKKHSADELKSRASQQGGGGARVVAEHIKTFRPKAGEHDIRVMPPTWEDAKGFGIEVYIHRNIGPDGDEFICLQQMEDKPCAACEERNQAEKDGEAELAKALKPVKRVGFFLIDRKEVSAGPKMWLSPWTFERDMSALALDKKTGEIFQLDDPEDGFDVAFTVTGEKRNTKYGQISVARRSSPLSDDVDQSQEWLDYIVENTIPNVLIVPEYDEVKQALMGGVRLPDDDDDGKEKKAGEEKPAGRPRIAGGSSPAARPKVGKKEEKEPEAAAEEPAADLPNWDEAHQMSMEDLEAAVDELKLNPEDFADCEGVEQIQDRFCEVLEIKAPFKSGGTAAGKDGKGAPTLKERLAALRKNRT